MFSLERARLCALILLSGSITMVHAQGSRNLDARIKAIMARPEFAHARFGMEVYSADGKTCIYQLNEQQLFVPGSTTKLLTEGTALQLLGSDYRFHTRVYRTGPINGDTLNGDLVLLASGDPNLSNRIQPDGTLAFENEDHSYGGPDSKGLSGNPSLVIYELARQIAAKGIRRITGRLLIDGTLFAEGERELGTGVVMSPIVVNDNLVDVVAAPGVTVGAPVTLQIKPKTSYLNLINKAVTGPAGSKATLDYKDDLLNSDGTRTVVITGSLALGSAPEMQAYHPPQPSSYAAMLMQEALKEVGVTAALPASSDKIDFKAIIKNYTTEDVVAEHVSPPFKEEVKVTLKVSQNLHASMTPYLLGALLAKKTDDPAQDGFDLERAFLTRQGLDLTAAVQSDGAGGNAYFTPDFMVHFLLSMSHAANFDDYYRALPIMGKDGSLFKIQVNSPAAGHVHAKTGTYAVYDALNKNLLVSGKGLAGYMDTKTGQHLVFALYVNNVSVTLEDPEAVQKVAGEALGEIASLVYDAN